MERWTILLLLESLPARFPSSAPFVTSFLPYSKQQNKIPIAKHNRFRGLVGDRYRRMSQHREPVSSENVLPNQTKFTAWCLLYNRQNKWFAASSQPHSYKKSIVSIRVHIYTYFLYIYLPIMLMIRYMINKSIKCPYLFTCFCANNLPLLGARGQNSGRKWPPLHIRKSNFRFKNMSIIEARKHTFPIAWIQVGFSSVFTVLFHHHQHIVGRFCFISFLNCIYVFFFIYINIHTHTYVFCVIICRVRACVAQYVD